MKTKWSCLAESAAMALGISYEELIEAVGHNGSTIIFPELPDPGCRRGFHMQEIIDVAIKKGFAVTPIEPLPCSTPDGLRVYTVGFTVERFQNHLAEGAGIVTGMKRKWRHAVFWNRGVHFDPATGKFSFENLNMNIDCFYKFTLSNQYSG